MQHDFDVFLAIAEIAGVFVGFGALIAITRAADGARGDLIRLGSVVTIGLYVIVGALVPVALGRYGLDGGALWRWSGAVLLVGIWFGIIVLIRVPEIRAFLRADARDHPASAFFFYVVLELPIHIVLILVLFGVPPSQGPALYTTALVLALFEAATVLSQLVYSRLLRA